MMIRIFPRRDTGRWQGIIGNAYNSEITTISWALWINTQGYLCWSSRDTFNILTELGVLEDVNIYEIRMNFRENILKFYLIKLDTREIKTQSIKKGTLITDKGFVTIGGEWINRPDEKFSGDITWVEMLVTDVELSKYSETTSLSNI